jgi:hypothetical protein
MGCIKGWVGIIRAQTVTHSFMITFVVNLKNNLKLFFLTHFISPAMPPYLRTKCALPVNSVSYFTPWSKYKIEIKIRD